MSLYALLVRSEASLMSMSTCRLFPVARESTVATRMSRVSGANLPCTLKRKLRLSPSIRSFGTGKSEGEAKGTVRLMDSLKQATAKFLGPKEMPPRWTFAWYREMVLICTVFAVTGSSTMMLVRTIEGERNLAWMITDLMALV